MIKGGEMKRVKFWTASMMPALLYLPLHQGIFPAYIDPGTGSIILQAVIGVLFGAIVALKLFWRQVKAFVGSLFSKFKRNEKHED
jgi:hypothetical protein